MHSRQTETEYREEADVILEEVSERVIVLYNDDFNTFDHVIECLVEICDHDPLQAEQCALIVHYKGKCAVKSGYYEVLEPMATALLSKNLTVEIE